MTCPGCGSYRVTDSLLCSPCSSALRRLQRPRLTEIDGLRVRSLYDWIPGESDLLSRYLRALKGPLHREAWRMIAWEFLLGHQVEPRAPASVRFIPAPPRGRRPDHATFFARGIAEIIGGPVVENLLCRVGGVSQKRLGREERSFVGVHVKMPGSVPPDGVECILVDDVVTTASTAKSILKSLSWPEHAELWVLARRTTFLADALAVC